MGYLNRGRDGVWSLREILEELEPHMKGLKAQSYDLNPFRRLVVGN